MRAGVYAFLDLKQVGQVPWSLDECALTVLASIVRHPRPDMDVLDAGRRACAGKTFEWGTNG